MKALCSFLATVLIVLSCGAGVCVADDFSSLELRLEAQRQELLPGEHVIITLEITNTGTKDTRLLEFVTPGLREFKFTLADAQGREILSRVNEGRRQERLLKPGESFTSRFDLADAYHFNCRTNPGKYALWVEYIPERQWKNTEIPVLAQSNVLEFDVRAPTIIEEESVKKKFQWLSSGSGSMLLEKKFKVFVHRGKDSNRLYWTRLWGLKDESNVWSYIRIADNVKPGSFDMAVDDYGNTHVWYQTANGDFHRFTKWNTSQHYPGHYPGPPVRFGGKEWEDLDDVPEGCVPRFNVKEDRVEIEYVSAPPKDADGEEPRLPPPVRVQPPEPPGREEPEADETGRELGAGHWIVIGVIALTAIVIAGVLIKKKR